MTRLGALLNRGAIFCFHAVDAPGTPSASVSSVTLNQFVMLLEAVERAGEIVPLGTIVDRVVAGRSCRGLIALTFDDAYESVDQAIVPVITARQIPITLFPVTDVARRPRGFWWDRLDDVSPHVGAARWLRFEDETGLPEAYRLGQPVAFGRLRPLRQWILAEGKGRIMPSVDEALAHLEHETNTTTMQRPMAMERIVELCATGLVEVGVHTASHTVLPLLSDNELHGEIAGAHRALCERLPRVLPVLAIPFGLYDRRTLASARAFGMQASLTLAQRAVNARATDGSLPRFTVTRRTTAAAVFRAIYGLLEAREALHRGRTPYPALPSPTS